MLPCQISKQGIILIVLEQLVHAALETSLQIVSLPAAHTLLAGYVLWSLVRVQSVVFSAVVTNN